MLLFVVVYCYYYYRATVLIGILNEEQVSNKDACSLVLPSLDNIPLDNLQQALQSYLQVVVVAVLAVVVLLLLLIIIIIRMEELERQQQV